MGFLAGGALKLFQTFLYALNFCAGAVVLGIYSYFLWWHDHRNLGIPTWEKAVEGLSGSACLYCIFAVLLTCILGGVSFFAFLGIVLDVLFTGAFVAIAVLTRHGADSCSGDKELNTPIGEGLGDDYSFNSGTKYKTACHLNTAAFAVSIIGAFLFALSTLIQLAIARNHKREKRFGPSPANNYTSGSGNRWFNRKRGPATTRDAYAADAETGIVGGTAVTSGGGLAAPAADVRPSHDTAYTGSTMAGNGAGYAGDKYQTPPVPMQQGGYHTAPTGTGVNPYGYDNTRPTNF